MHFERLPFLSDERGFVFDPLDADRLAEQRNAHVVITLPGHVRGNHRHPGTETLTVLGPALVRVKEGGVADTEVPRGEIYRFTIPPNVPHAIKNTGHTTGIIVCFNDLPLDPQKIVRDRILD